MTRVLHLITRYLDGGSETTTKNTLEALSTADAGYLLYLGTGAEHDPSRLSELESLGVTTTVFRWIRHYNPFAAAVAVFQVAWFLRREDIDVLHTHGTEAGVIGPLAGTFAGTPVVIHEIHGDPITEDRNWALSRFLLFCERLSARMTDRLIVKSERIRETYLRRGIGTPDQYEVIYHGVETDRFRDITVDEADGDDGPVILLFVGRVTEGKGLFDLLDALERLIEEGREVRLQIAGDGPLTDDLRGQIEDRDLPAELLGYRDDVPELMAGADVLVLPSYREGTPRVITEAMASGLPVVSTNIAGIPEQVVHGESGYLVPPGEVDALTDRLAVLVDDRETRERFGMIGRERATKFNIETARSSYRDLYRSL